MEMITTTIYIEQDFKELFTGYLFHRSEDVQQIESSLIDMDFKTIAKLSNMMRWSGSTHGFDHISEIGDTMEKCANQRDFIGVISQLELLKDFLERLEIIYI